MRAATLAGEADVLTELVRLDAREILGFGLSETLLDALRRALPRAALRKLDSQQLAAAEQAPEVRAAG